MSELILTKGIKGIADTVSYNDGTSLALADLMSVEPALIFPEKVIRIEYVQGKRLSFFTEDGQFGPDFAFEGTWDLGDKLIVQKPQYIEAIEEAKPVIPEPDPQPDPQADLKAKLDTYLAGDGSDLKSLKAFLTEWRKLLVSVLIVLLTAAPSWALEHYSNVAQDQNGRAIVGATINVYLAGTTTAATIYSDNGVTLKANPFTTAIDGIYDFYAAQGRYDIKITKTGYTSIYWDPNKTKGLTLFDPTQFVVPFGAAFPASPITGMLFVLTGDGGLCIPESGSSPTLCRWDGISAWSVIGGAGGGGASGLDANFDLSGGNIITGADETKKLTLFGSGAGATSGWQWWMDTSGFPMFRCVMSNVLGDCHSDVLLNANKHWRIKNSGGTVVTDFDSGLGKFTTFTADAEDAGIALARPFYWDLDLCAINPADSSLSHVWNKDPLSTAPTLTAKAGTNRSTCMITFPDSDGDYGVSIARILPAGFIASGFDADIWWETTGTGNARFQIATKCYADDEADDAANNTASVVTSAAGTSGRQNKQTITGITITGCAADEKMRIRFFRNRTEGSDTLNAALNVEKIRFKGRATK